MTYDILPGVFTEINLLSNHNSDAITVKMFFLLIVEPQKHTGAKRQEIIKKRQLDLGCQVAKNGPNHGKKQFIINYLNDESSYSHFLNLKNNKYILMVLSGAELLK